MEQASEYTKEDGDKNTITRDQEKKKPIACRIRSPCNEMSKSLVTRRAKKNWKGEGKKK